MITKFECTCGNDNPNKAKEYDGCLGYEALICTDCGRYQDYNGVNEPNEFSMLFIDYH